MLKIKLRQHLALGKQVKHSKCPMSNNLVNAEVSQKASPKPTKTMLVLSS